MSKAPPDSQCNAQPGVVSFNVTDTEIWIYVAFSGQQANDSPKIEWLDGSGKVAATTTFQPITLNNTCLYGSLTTAKTPVAISPGIWTAHGTWNGADLFLLNFFIVGAASGGPAPTGSSLSGLWQLTTSCTYYGNAILSLTEAADGSLSGTVTGNQNKTSILANASGYQGDLANFKSAHSGNTLSLVLYPDGWISVLALTGNINGNQISGNIHHYGNDDCTFNMARAGGAPGQVSSYGAVLLLRLAAQLGPGQDFSADVGAGLFAQTAAISDIGIPAGPSTSAACLAFSGSLDLNAVLSGGLSPPSSSSSALLSSVRLLDAGASLSVTGQKGTVALPLLSSSSPGVYLGQLGGVVPLAGGSALPPFLDPGSFSIAGPGGKDVGSFTASLAIPATTTALSNPGQFATINRSAAATLTWTGGDSSRSVLISGAASDQTSKVTGAFFCLAPATAASFTVPSAVLNVLPPVGNPTSISSGGGILMFASVPSSAAQMFTAKGVDLGVVLDVSMNLLAAAYQ